MRRDAFLLILLSSALRHLLRQAIIAKEQNLSNNNFHKRSNVESTMWISKSKFSELIRSKIDTAIVNELLCGVLCHYICGAPFNR
jgi:hypothetical protein